MKNLRLKRRVLTGALCVCIAGFLTMWALGCSVVFGFGGIGVFMTLIYFSAGVVYMGYEGFGTPENIAINLGFHAFLILTVVLIVLLARAYRERE